MISGSDLYKVTVFFLLRKKGVVINISSSAGGIMPLSLLGAYGATKVKLQIHACRNSSHFSNQATIVPKLVLNAINLMDNKRK